MTFRKERVRTLILREAMVITKNDSKFSLGMTVQQLRSDTDVRSAARKLIFKLSSRYIKLQSSTAEHPEFFVAPIVVKLYVRVLEDVLLNML